VRHHREHRGSAAGRSYPTATGRLAVSLDQETGTLLDGGRRNREKRNQSDLMIAEIHSVTSRQS